MRKLMLVLAASLLLAGCTSYDLCKFSSDMVGFASGRCGMEP